MEEIAQLALKIAANEKTIKSFQFEFNNLHLDGMFRIEQMRRENEMWLKRLKEIAGNYDLP